MKTTFKTLTLHSDFPILSRNRSIDENLPFNEAEDASIAFYM
jgi:hypothetical protein